MTSTITYVRFGKRTECYSWGKVFRPPHPTVSVCDDCLSEVGRTLVQKPKLIKVMELDDLPDGVA